MARRLSLFSGFAAWIAVAVSVHACSGGDPVSTPADGVPLGGMGPRVRWDLGQMPFPEIPMPNDVATIADNTSPTGIRLNASMVAGTAFEASLREQVDEMDGWGTSMPISIAFDQDLDVPNILSRHQADEFDFRNDVIYVVNLTTGLPVPLDIGSGHYPLTLNTPQGWFPNDPRAGQSNLLLSTIDEDTNHDGILEPSEDTNFDGIMQRAAVYPAGAAPENGLTPFWEPEGPSGGTLIVRPMIPLDERTRYAVIVTDRLVGANGPVRSPFPTIAHPSQLAYLQPMQTYLADPTLSPTFYGGLAWNPAMGTATPNGRVVFAWTFSTETTVTDLFDVRNGLYGTGPYAGIGLVDPAFGVFPSHGGNSCTAMRHSERYIVDHAELQSLLSDLLPVLGYQGPQGEALVASYDWVDYAYIAEIQTPYLAGNPQSIAPDDRWHLNPVGGGTGPIGIDNVQLWTFIPKATATTHAPFPVAFYPHGYGVGAIQSIAFAGYFARLGFATVAANAPTHGFPFPTDTASALSAEFRDRCLIPWITAVLAGRSRDLDGSGNLISGGDYLSAHIFHTRDMVRQTALDYMQVIRTYTSPAWSSTQAINAVDYNGDGTIDAPGDLNGDGVVDIGGTPSGSGPAPFFMWGESLGGITSMVVGGVEPEFTAVSPVSGGAILTDVAMRSDVSGVGGAVIAPILTPALVAIASEQLPPNNGLTTTSCGPGQASLRWVVQDANNVGYLEIACTATSGSTALLLPGDDVVAYDFNNQAERCARVPSDGTLFLPVAADQGDMIAITVFMGGVISDYGACTRDTNAPVRSLLRTYQVGQGDCDQSCGYVPTDAQPGSLAIMQAVQQNDPITAPSAGLGLRRQTSELRRFMQLAQAGLDPGDPVNYAPLFFLHSRTPNVHPVLAMSTLGDPDVPVSTGNAFARAAGLMPFIGRPTGTLLDEYVSPMSIWNRYSRTPDGVLVDHHIIEGVARLNRYPVPMGADYLFSPDVLDDGLALWGEASLTPPLRVVRGAAPLSTDGQGFQNPVAQNALLEAMWAPAPATPMAGFLNVDVEPAGVHAFYPSDPSQPWDSGAYLANLIAHYFQANGTDIYYDTNPTGHECLATNTCSFIPQQ